VRTLGFAALLGVSLVVLNGCAGIETAARIVRRNVASIDDHRFFPSRPVPVGRESRPIPRTVVPIEIENIEYEGRSLAAILRDSKSVAFLAHRSEIVVETYDREYTERTPIMSFSIAKSILSKYASDRIGVYVPKLTARGFSDTTIEDLLSMTSGVDHAENDNPFGRHVRMYYTDRLESEILSLRRPAGAEDRFVDNSGDPMILALVLSRAFGAETISSFPSRALEPRSQRGTGESDVLLCRYPEGLRGVRTRLPQRRRRAGRTQSCIALLGRIGRRRDSVSTRVVDQRRHGGHLRGRVSWPVRLRQPAERCRPRPVRTRPRRVYLRRVARDPGDGRDRDRPYSFAYTRAGTS
jgi:hypothetical protein